MSTAVAERLTAMRRIDWVVYAKKPFSGPAQVLAYLGRYRRIATRYDKLARNFLSAVAIAAVILWWA